MTLSRKPGAMPAPTTMARSQVGGTDSGRCSCRSPNRRERRQRAESVDQSKVSRPPGLDNRLIPRRPAVEALGLRARVEGFWTLPAAFASSYSSFRGAITYAMLLGHG